MSEKEKLIDFGEGYRSEPDGTQYKADTKVDKNGKPYEECTTFSNTTVFVDKMVKRDNGMEITEEIVVHTKRNYRVSEPISVSPKVILGQTPNLPFGLPCRIYPGRNTKEHFRQAIQIQCENIPTETVYEHIGFKRTPEGELIYLNGEHSVTKEGLTDKYCVELGDTLDGYKFTAEQDENRYKTMLVDLPKVAPQEVVYCGLAMSFLSPLNLLLREVGIEPGFILYFVGKTGSYKSTISKLFLNFFGEFDYNTPAPANFKDTPNAVAAKLARVGQALSLLDDRIPNATPSDTARMDAIEQSVARGVGDRAGRGRLNSDMNLRTTPRPNCNLIITAEMAYNNVGESGVARSIAVELSPPDNDTIQNIYRVQDNAAHLNQCMSEYVRWVLCNWDSLKAELKPLFRCYLDEMKSDGHARLNTTVAHLQLGIYTMCKWLESVAVLSHKDSCTMQSKSKVIFKQLAEEQNKRITDEKPVKMFLEAVRELLDSKSIAFKPVTAANMVEVKDCVGYCDKDFYYCYPGKIYSAVREYYARQGKVFPLNQAALFKHLADDCAVQTDAKQNTKVKRTGDGKRSRLLWLRVSALNDEKEDD